MDDTLNVKPLVLSSGTYASAVPFPRVIGKDPQGRSIRQSLVRGSLSPLQLILDMIRGTAKKPNTRNLVVVDQKLARLDADGILIKTDSVTVSLQITRTPGVTLAEYKEAIGVAVGFVAQDNGVFVEPMFNGEG